MTTPDEPTKLEIESRIRELLGRATLARARGRHEQALTLVQEAINLDDAESAACSILSSDASNEYVARLAELLAVKGK